MPTTPHDSLFKRTFEWMDWARAAFEALLPRQLCALLDLSTLVVESGELLGAELQAPPTGFASGAEGGSLRTDLLYSVRTRDGRSAFIYFLFEHQSTYDSMMPFRILRYVVRIWERRLRQHPEARTLPLVIPLVMFHGNEGWKTPPELESIIEAGPELMEASRPFVPHFEFVLDDLSAVSLEDLAARPIPGMLRVVLIALAASRSASRMRQMAQAIRNALEGEPLDAHGRAMLARVFRYVFQTAEVQPEEVQRILVEAVGPEEGEGVMTAADILMERGRIETLRGAIERILDMRSIAWSPGARERLRACSDVTTLTLWLDRAVMAASEEDVFGVR